jgi:hypothetical protein
VILRVGLVGSSFTTGVALKSHPCWHESKEAECCNSAFGEDQIIEFFLEEALRTYHTRSFVLIVRAYVWRPLLNFLIFSFEVLRGGAVELF